MSGIELVHQLRAHESTIPLFLMTAHASIATAVDGMRAGATDFLLKPLDADAAYILIDRAVRGSSGNARAPRDGGARPDTAQAPEGEALIVGSHPRLQPVRGVARKVALLPDT